MTELLVHPSEEPTADGTLVCVTPESAGWGYVGFEILDLGEGRAAQRQTDERELCVVVVSGRCVVSSVPSTSQVG